MSTIPVSLLIATALFGLSPSAEGINLKNRIICYFSNENLVDNLAAKKAKLSLSF